MTKKYLKIATLPVAFILLKAETINISDKFQPGFAFNNSVLQLNRQGVGGLGSLIYSAIFGFGVVIAFILIIVGGIKIITSGGEPNAIAAGRKTITYAIIGVVVMLLPWLIIYIVQALIKTAAN